jgi:hypothetical protein
VVDDLNVYAVTHALQHIDKRIPRRFLRGWLLNHEAYPLQIRCLVFCERQVPLGARLPFPAEFASATECEDPF